MEILGYIAAVVIFGVFLAIFHDVLVEEDETMTGLGMDLPVAATLLIAHAAVAALTSTVVALVGTVIVIAVMLRPIRWVKQRMERAGFDVGPRDGNAPRLQPSAANEPTETAPVETREPVTAGGGGLTSEETRVWEDLTRRLDT